MVAPVTTSPWDLWVLQALDPTATAADVDALVQARRRCGDLEAELFRRLKRGETGLLQPDRRLLAERPELTRGLVVTLHLGPYSLVLEPYLAAGRPLHVLVNRAAMERLKPVADGLGDPLGHRSSVAWHPVDDPGCARELLRALRADEPLLAFIDGNPCATGSAGTRRDGLPFQLPGDDPVHRPGPVRRAHRLRRASRLRALGRPPRPVGMAPPADPALDPPRRPAGHRAASLQLGLPWKWRRRRGSGRTGPCSAAQPPSASSTTPPTRPCRRPLSRDYGRAFAIALARSADTVCLEVETQLAIWPGDLLADLGHDAFYDAGGLTPADLDLLVKTRPDPVRTGHGPGCSSGVEARSAVVPAGARPP